MSGGDKYPVTSAFHRSVCAIIRIQLNDFTANPVGFIERESKLENERRLLEALPLEGTSDSVLND